MSQLTLSDWSIRDSLSIIIGYLNPHHLHNLRSINREMRGIIPFDDSYVKEMIKDCSMSQLEYYWDNIPTQKIPHYAVKYGCLDILIYSISRLKAMNQPYDITKLPCRAAKYGNLEILKWLYEINVQLNDFMEVAIYHKKLPIIQWAIENRIPHKKENLCNLAASSGNQVLFFNLFYSDYPIDQQTLDAAVRGNNHEIIFFLLNKGLCFKDETMKYCAMCGNTDLLKYLHRYYPLTDESFYYAVAFNKMEIIKYFLDNGYTINPLVHYQINDIAMYNLLKSYGIAINFRHLQDFIYYKKMDMFIYSYEQGNYSQYNDVFIMEAAVSGNIELLSYFYSKKITIGKSAGVFAAKKNITTVKWLAEHGCKIGKRACAIALLFKEYDIFRWIMRNICAYSYDKLQKTIDKMVGIEEQMSID